nr:PREDICTED: 1-aminocyclopropane-1-carboxylate oxidase homolog [Daucus carota subsp. sativus]
MEAPLSTTSSSNRQRELQAFDDTKAGVKGLVESGVQKIPSIFVHPPDAFDKNSNHKCKEFSIPVVDLGCLDKDPMSHQEIVDKVRCASETFGFFQVVNHGIPVTVLEEMLHGEQVMKLGITLFGLLSKALGLDINHLEDMECAKGLELFCHCYPPCPQPELTLGTTKHTDFHFLTVLLQDQIGGLQILYQDHWIDVPPLPGTLIVNIGDLLQLLTNDRFKSVEHRVVAKKIGPRVSVACFFSTGLMPSPIPKLYGPIKQLVSEDNPPKYRETTAQEYLSYSYSKGLDGESRLLHFRLK